MTWTVLMTSARDRNLRTRGLTLVFGDHVMSVNEEISTAVEIPRAINS